MRLKNRIVFPPIGTRFAGLNGEATQLDVDHYAARAKGGAGLLVVPWVQVETKLGRKIGRHRIDSDEHIRGFREVVEAVHLNDAKIAIQLSHPGRAMTADEAGKEAPISASESYCQPFGTTSRPLFIEEIDYLVESFASAAIDRSSPKSVTTAASVLPKSVSYCSSVRSWGCPLGIVFEPVRRRLGTIWQDLA